MYSVSDDMINMMLKQMGAVSIKSSPAYVNVVKFDVVPDVPFTYVYEIKDECIYLQRIDPYPMRIGKLYSELDIIEFIGRDLNKFKSAYNSANFGKFLRLTKEFATLDRKIEHLFMTRNVEGEELDKLEVALKEANETIDEITEASPIL